jgi:hypothetical protein
MPSPEGEERGRGIGRFWRLVRSDRFWEIVGAIPSNLTEDQLASQQDKGLPLGKFRTPIEDVAEAIGAIPKEPKEANKIETPKKF